MCFCNIINDVKEPTKINAIVYENPYTSLETEDINPNWGNTPIIMKINRLGAFRNVCDNYMGISIPMCGHKLSHF